MGTRHDGPPTTAAINRVLIRTPSGGGSSCLQDVFERDDAQRRPGEGAAGGQAVGWFATITTRTCE